MKLSIVICVYNTPKKYLRACFESIRSSTISKYDGEYEICMVDDGSCEDYSDLISEFNINATKTENRGIFAARSLGAKIAKGEYIIFCDSDDTVSFNYYLPMLELAEREKTDIVINDWAYNVNELKYYCKNDVTIKKNIDLKDEEIISFFVKQRGRYFSLFVLWNKLYKGELLKKAFLEIEKSGYPESSNYSEDMLINFLAWKNAKSVKNIHSGYYFYRIHQSQTVNTKELSKIKSQIYYLSKTFEIIEDNLNSSELICDLNEWRKYSSRYHYTIAKENGFSELYSYIKEQYKVDNLKKSTRRDGSPYVSKVLLGDNFDSVDKIFRDIFRGKKKKKINHPKKGYIRKCVDFLLENDKVELTTKRKSDIIIPKLKSSLKRKIAYNPICYKISLMILGKNSKLRRFFKKHI